MPKVLVLINLRICSLYFAVEDLLKINNKFCSFSHFVIWSNKRVNVSVGFLGDGEKPGRTQQEFGLSSPLLVWFCLSLWYGMVWFGLSPWSAFHFGPELHSHTILVGFAPSAVAFVARRGHNRHNFEAFL